MKVPTFLAGLL